MVIFDTCILIDICRGNLDIKDKISLLNTNQILISAITEFEFLAGARNKKEFLLISKQLSQYNVIPINNEISDLFLQLGKSFSLSHKISVPDMLIAATALYYDIPIFTSNLKDFQFIPNIKLI